MKALSDSMNTAQKYGKETLNPGVFNHSKVLLMSYLPRCAMGLDFRARTLPLTESTSRILALLTVS